MPVILLGSADESDLCRTVADRIRHLQPGARVLNLAGKSSLSESAAVLDRCAVVLTNDSGLMHLAAARKRKLVAIFGPTVSQFGFFPVGTDSIVLEERDLRCRPCTHIGLPVCPRGHFRCMNDIPVSRVVAAAREILSHS
jgi:heptosyltransferase-2